MTADGETINLTWAVPVRETADVIVVGGGSAGIAAAVAAARNGASVLLVERYGFLGGTATAGLVGPFMTSYGADGARPVVAGILRELVDRMVAAGGAVDPARTGAGSAWSSFIELGHAHVTPFDPEALKMAALDLVREAGVRIRFHTSFADALVEGERISGIVILDKAGLGILRNSVVVDTSGDGDVAVRAGAPFEIGRAGDGRMMPATLFLRIGDVDDARVEAWMREHREIHPGERLFECIVREARARGDWTLPREYVNLYREPRPGEWRVNTTRVHGIDGTDPDDLSRAEIEARDQVRELIPFLRKNCPGLENARLLETGAQVGIRETRHILGDYVLTGDDVREGRRFADAIARCAYPIDIHDPVGTRGRLEGMTGGEFYDIPYRCLLPRNVDNLLVAGRCLSADHEAAASARVIPPCYATGQAAGTAAALSSRDGIPLHHLDVHLLQDTLREQGAIV